MSAARIALADVSVGQELPTLETPIERSSLVRYAGASGDFNRIHWDEAFAREVGLDDVIAHGMLSMGVAAEVVAQWCQDPGAIQEYSVRFTRPVVVARETPSVLVVSGVVASIDPETATCVVDLTARCGEDAVLGKARAVVKLS